MWLLLHSTSSLLSPLLPPPISFSLFLSFFLKETLAQLHYLLCATLSAAAEHIKIENQPKKIKLQSMTWIELKNREWEEKREPRIRPKIRSVIGFCVQITCFGSKKNSRSSSSSTDNDSTDISTDARRPNFSLLFYRVRATSYFRISQRQNTPILCGCE